MVSVQPTPDTTRKVVTPRTADHDLSHTSRLSNYAHSPQTRITITCGGGGYQSANEVNIVTESALQPTNITVNTGGFSQLHPSPSPAYGVASSLRRPYSYDNTSGVDQPLAPVPFSLASRNNPPPSSFEDETHSSHGQRHKRGRESRSSPVPSELDPPVSPVTSYDPSDEGITGSGHFGDNREVSDSGRSSLSGQRRLHSTSTQSFTAPRKYGVPSRREWQRTGDLLAARVAAGQQILTTGGKAEAIPTVGVAPVKSAKKNRSKKRSSSKRTLPPSEYHLDL